MRRPCPKVITCAGIGTQPEPDWPVTNYSAEAPDPLVFAAIVYPNIGIEPAGCFYTRTCPEFTANSCYGIVFSSESQEDADALAQAASIMCPTGIPDPNGQIFANNARSATVRCGNGTSFTFTAQAGLMVSGLLNAVDGAAWQIMADDWAAAYALERATALLNCITTTRPGSTSKGPLLEDNPGFGCLGEVLDPDQNTYEVTNANGSYVFEVVAGQLPPDTTLIQTSPTSAVLSGTLTQVGFYTYTIRASRAGNSSISAEVTDHLDVLGIVNCDTIPEAKCDKAYSFQLIGGGGQAPFTFEMAPGYSLPSGLSLSPQGLIDGTPDGFPESKHIIILIRDSSEVPRTCECDTTFTVKGPKILCPIASGQVCVPFSATVTAIPAGCVFSATGLPGGLTMNSAGHISGTPKTVSPSTYEVTATESNGDSNTKTCNITITNPGTANAAQDMVWTVSYIPAGPCLSAQNGVQVNSLQLFANGNGCCNGIAINQGVVRFFASLRNCSGPAYNLHFAFHTEQPIDIKCGGVNSSGITLSLHDSITGLLWTATHTAPGPFDDSHDIVITSPMGTITYEVNIAFRGPSPANTLVTLSPAYPS